MENQLTTTPNISYDILESLVLNGDLSKLDQKQKVEYYQKYCTALGLNPITQPFSILKLNGKEKLYCGREGTAQLSKVHNVSHDIVSTETQSGVYIVKAKASQNNRHTTSTGVVFIENLKGESLCNALMKAETKAKRRATLDLLGLGMLDETEVETIPGAKTEDVNYTDVTSSETKNPHPFMTIEEKIEEAKATLIVANKDNFGTIWKSLSAEMQVNEEVLAYGKELSKSLGVTSKKD